MFTLSHHVIVDIAHQRTGRKGPPCYCILGDDIVIRGSHLAREYLRLIQDLGVKISEAKTHVSRDTFEFAKTWSHRGVDVSGFPLPGFVSLVHDNPAEFASLVMFEAPSKGFPFQVNPRCLSE
jgi:hypothetical protein